MKSIGIDIGTYSVKVAEIDSNRSAIELSNFAEFPLSLVPNADHQLEIIEILRRIAEQYDPATTRITVAVPQNRVATRFKRFPFRERQKILKSLAFELEDEIPLDIGSAVFDGKICAYVGNAANVLAFACPEESIREAINRTREGGLDPEIVSTESAALANLFERWDQLPIVVTEPAEINLPEGVQPPPPQARVARVILQLGHSRSQLLVYRDGELVATRNILWGGAEIAQALAKTFSLPYGEAVKILQTKSFILMSTQGASRDQVLLSKTVSDVVDVLSRELKLALIDIGAELNLVFKNLELIGGVSQIQNVGPYLTQALELPVNLFHPFEYFNVMFERTPRAEGASSIAIGLAIEGLKRPRNPAVNFRKGEFAKQNNTFNMFWERWKPAFQTAMVALLLLFVYGVIRDSLATDLAATAEDVVTTQGRTIAGARSTSQIERYIRTQNQQIKNREVLAQLDNVNASLDLLARLAEKLPINEVNGGQKVTLDVRHFSVVNDNLILEGKVQNPAHIRAIEQGLRQVAIPESVKTARVNPNTKIEAPGTAFAFHAKVKRQ